MFTFERASESDFQRLFDLRLLAMRESLERVGRFDERRAFERFRSSFRPQYTRLIINPDGSLAGCVAIGPSEDALLLEHFYIFPERQGGGLGSAVLRQLLDEADIAGLPVRLSVLRQSEAGRFYARHGFAVIGRDDWDVYYERWPGMIEKGAAFRALHEEQGAFIIPNPWDIGTARILASMGFRALATTSAGMAFSLGVPEGQVSREDTLSHCRTIVAATPLPVSADLEKGFGDSPESVAETIRAAADIGLAGCSIEDHTNRRDDPIFDFRLAVERIEAGAQACRALPHDFVLTARCENFLWGRPDLDDTIKRLQAFEKAGADVLYAPGLHDLGTIRTVCDALTKPVNIVMGMPGATFGVVELAEAGVKRISIGSALARLAFGSFVKAAREMKSGGTFQFSDSAMGFAELESFFAVPAAT